MDPQSNKICFSNLPPGTKQIICSFLNMREMMKKFQLIDRKTYKLVFNSAIAKEGKKISLKLL